MGNGGFCVDFVGVEDVCCSAVMSNCDVSNRNISRAGWHTVSVHWHIQISDLAIVAEDLAEMLLVDVLGEFLNDDLSRLAFVCTQFFFGQFSPLCSG